MAGVLDVLKKKRDELLSGLGATASKMRANYRNATGQDLNLKNVATNFVKDATGFASFGTLGSKNTPTYRISDKSLHAGRALGNYLEQQGHRKLGQTIKDVGSLISGSTRLTPGEIAGNMGFGSSNSRIIGSPREQALQGIGQTATGLILTSGLNKGRGLEKLANMAKNTMFGTGLGASISGVSALASGQKVLPALKEGALSGAKNSYLLPITNGISDKLIHTGSKFIKPLAQLHPNLIKVNVIKTGSLAKAGQYGKATKNAFKIIGKSALSEAVKSPLETAAFSLDDKLRNNTNQSFSQRYKQRFTDDLIGNAVFGAGTSAVGQALGTASKLHALKNETDKFLQNVPKKQRAEMKEFYRAAHAVKSGVSKEAIIGNIGKLKSVVGLPSDTPHQVVMRAEFLDNLLKIKHQDNKNINFNKALNFVKTINMPERWQDLNDNRKLALYKQFDDFINKTVIKPIPAENKTFVTSSYVIKGDKKIKRNLKNSQQTTNAQEGLPDSRVLSPSSPIGIGDSKFPTSERVDVNIIPSNQAKSNNPDIVTNPLNKQQINKNTDVDIDSLTEMLVEPTLKYEGRKYSDFYRDINPLNNLTPEDKAIFGNWRANELNTKAKANQLAQQVDDLLGNPDPKTAWKITQYIQTPTIEKAAELGLENPEQYNQALATIRKILDTNYAQYKKTTGKDIGYLKDYLTQLWKTFDLDTPPSARTANINPTFTKERNITNYTEGVKQGLIPKYTHPAQIIADYYTKSQKAIGNYQLLQTLLKNGLLTTDNNKLPQGWQAVSAKAFKSFLEEQWKEVPAEEYQDFFKGKLIYAPRQIAEVLNNIFNQTPPNKYLEKGANLSKGMQSIKLSAGIPNTPINSFAMGNLIKELTGGNFRALKAYALSFNEKLTGDYFKKEDTKRAIDLMTQNGIKINSDVDFTEAFANVFDVNPTLKKRFGDTWSKLMEAPTFKRFLPISQIEFYKREMDNAIKRGLDEQSAAKKAAEITKSWMGLFDDYARNKNVRNAMNTILFAPTFRESMVNFWTNLTKAVPGILKNSPETQAQRNFLIGLTLQYGMMTLANKMLTGHYMHENKSGKVLELEIPQKDGTSAFVPLLPTVATLPRNAVEAGVAMLRGNYADVGQKLSGYASMPLQTVGQVLFNRDGIGREIYDKEDSTPKKHGKAFLHIVKSAAHPTISEPIEVMEGRKTPSQAAFALAEMPIRFGRSTDTSKLNKKEFETYQNMVKQGAGAREYAEQVNQLKQEKREVKKATGDNPSWFDKLFSGSKQSQEEKFTPPESEELKKQQRKLIKDKVATLSQDVSPDELIFAYLGSAETMPVNSQYEKHQRTKAFYSEYSKIEKDKYLTNEQKEILFNKIAGEIASGDAQAGREALNYYQIAKQDAVSKTASIYDWIDKNGIDNTTSEGHRKIIHYLIEARKKVNGKTIASNDVINRLYEDNIISANEKKALKKYGLGQKQQKTARVVGRTSRKNNTQVDKRTLTKANQLRTIKLRPSTIKRIKISPSAFVPPVINIAPPKLKKSKNNAFLVNPNALLRIAN